MTEKNKIAKSILIKAGAAKVWDVLTGPAYAKTLGNEFDKNAFLESDWQPGSPVHFKYESGKIVATGIITDYKLHSRIFMEYKDINYTDSYSLQEKNGTTNLSIASGPYPDDYNEQLEVWDKWLLKVKQLSEA
jgi:hypothetical protein